VSRRCDRKTNYTQQGAEQAVQTLRALAGRGVRAYRCPDCPSWHLTSRAEGGTGKLKPAWLPTLAEAVRR
jgi:hypothetical protein